MGENCVLGLMRGDWTAVLWVTLNGHEAGNGGYSHLSAVPGTGRRVGLKTVEPVLYSTLILHSIALQSTGR